VDIILKLACFSIWFIIMLCLINGSRRKYSPEVREVILQLNDEEDVEMCVHRTLKNLCTWDRLIIKDHTTSPRNRHIIMRILYKNPSILCISSEPYCF
jgi:hypothetical protein